jgi:hypothetical protein
MSKAKDEERASEFDRGAPENTHAAAVAKILFSILLLLVLLGLSLP